MPTGASNVMCDAEGCDKHDSKLLPRGVTNMIMNNADRCDKQNAKLNMM